MEIIKMRFGDHLQWNLILPSEWEKIKIPKLLIQPLVENAVLHGAGNKLKPCTISVTIQASSDRKDLEVIVEDDGPGIPKEKLVAIQLALQSGGMDSKRGRGNGMAISNVVIHLKGEEEQC
jgi:two-component system sensor histidine kinase YesM